MSGSISIKRIYSPSKPSDGARVLVDRIWPRGMTREAAKIDLWLKEVGPSPDLRKWFAHLPSRFDAFRKCYWKQLDENPGPVSDLCALVARGDVTLLYAAKDENFNHATVLAEYLNEHILPVETSNPRSGGENHSSSPILTRVLGRSR